MDVAKVKQVWSEMSKEEKDNYANSLSEEQFGQLTSALSVKQDAPAPNLDKTGIQARQQEYLSRASGPLGGIGLSPIDETGSGETLGQVVTKPENVRLGMELGGMVVGGMAGPPGLALAAARIPRLAAIIRGLTAKYPLATETAARGAGAAFGGGVGSLAAEPIAPSENPLESAAISGGKSPGPS